MFWQVVNVEGIKIVKRRILWIELALMALGVMALYTVGYSLIPEEGAGSSTPQGLGESLTWPAGITNALAFAAGPNLGGLMAIILVGAVVAQEYTWGTLQLWLSRGVPRPVLLGGKFTALMMPLALMVLTPLVAGGLLSAAFSQLILGKIPFDQVAWQQVGWDALRIAYTLLPYAALTFFLAVASRSTVVSIGGGLAYALLFEGVALQLIGGLGGFWGEIGRYLPGGLARGLMATNAGISVQVGDSPVTAVQYLEPGVAALLIGLYVLAFVAGSVVVFQQQDLSA